MPEGHCGDKSRARRVGTAGPTYSHRLDSVEPGIQDIQLLRELLKVDPELWRQEVAGIKEFYAKFGDKLPAELTHQLSVLENNLT